MNRAGGSVGEALKHRPKFFESAGIYDRIFFGKKEKTTWKIRRNT
jgi:hypothetical protein